MLRSRWSEAPWRRRVRCNGSLGDSLIGNRDESSRLSKQLLHLLNCPSRSYVIAMFKVLVSYLKVPLALDHCFLPVVCLG